MIRSCESLLSDISKMNRHEAFVAAIPPISGIYRRGNIWARTVTFGRVSLFNHLFQLVSVSVSVSASASASASVSVSVSVCVSVSVSVSFNFSLQCSVQSKCANCYRAQMCAPKCYRVQMLPRPNVPPPRPQTFFNFAHPLDWVGGWGRGCIISRSLKA